MRTVQQSIALFASLLLVLLLLLIVIYYDSVGVYSVADIVWCWWWWCCCFCFTTRTTPFPFPFPPHNKPPSQRVQYGVECNKCRVLVVVLLLWKIVVVLYNGAVLVGMTGWKDDRVTSIRDDVTISIVCRVRWIMYCPTGTIRIRIILLLLPLLSWLLLSIHG